MKFLSSTTSTVVISALLLLLVPSATTAFSVMVMSPSTGSSLRSSSTTSLCLLSATDSATDESEPEGEGGTIHTALSRRQVFSTVATTGAAVASTSFSFPVELALAADAVVKTVVVAGATGQTGSRIYERLASSDTMSVTGGVRNVDKAKKSLKNTATAPSLTHLDVVEDSLDTLTATLQGADGLIIACGMNPGKNLMRMSAAAHEVDNVGTCKLIDAAKAAGVKKVVLLSSILTNGRAWGQEKSAGFVATNAFGGALDEKLQAEQHLRAAASGGLDYTIVRPGGLKSGKPAGALSIHAEDTLNSGEISRDLVADVCVAALNDAKASNKVLEIIEDEGVEPPKVFNGLVM